MTIVFLLLWPFIELWLLFQLAEHTSGGTAFAFVVVSGLVGLAVLARAGRGSSAGQFGSTFFGRRAARATSQAMAWDELEATISYVAAGVLLLLPGVLTDLLAVALFIPPLRRLLWRLLSRQVRGMTASGKGWSEVRVWTSSTSDPTNSPADSDVLDATYVSRSPPQPTDCPSLGAPRQE